MKYARWVLACASVIAGCGRLGFEPEGETFFDDYTHRKLISIHSPVASTLEAFPVSIVLAGDPDLAGRVRADGGDLVFTTLDGARLPSEIVTLDAAAGDVEAWVALPALPGDATTSIYLYFGGASTTRESPWSDVYAAAWHMNLAGTSALDSAAGHAAVPLTTPPGAVPAVVGLGVDFDGVEHTLEVGDPTDGSLDFGTRSFGYALWVRAGTPVGPYDTPLHKGGSSAPTAGYDFELGADEWSAYLSDGTTQIELSVGSDAELTGTWAHLAVVADRTRGEYRSFVNGVVRESLSVSTLGSVDSDLGLTFSRPPVLAHHYRGILDEVRIYNGAVSDDWIAAEYANVVARETMITIGALESR